MVCNRTLRPVSVRGGFTLLEASFATALLMLVFTGLASAIRSMQNLAHTARERGAIQTEGQDALVEILRDLRRSGIVMSGGIRYPVVFDGGDAGPAHPDHTHQPASKSGEPGDEDAGQDRSILFLLPRDADGDRRPDVDANGELIWDWTVFSYVLVTGPDGINRLERRSDGAQPRVLARSIERIVFDDAGSSGFEIPLGSVRVRLFFRRVDASGQVQRFTTEAIVTLRNT